MMSDHSVRELSQDARSRFQTFRRSFEQICAGEDPWIPLGKFMHQFFGEFKDYRGDLLHDSIVIPLDVTAEQFQWAVFCAASVEHLCARYGLDCPQWALEPALTLAEPWYQGLGANSPHLQAKLRLTTPGEFARHNIWCGNRIYQNKYEKHGRMHTAIT